MTIEDRHPAAQLQHRPDCPAPLVLTTKLRHSTKRGIGRCVNCERVGLIDLDPPDVSRET